MCAHRGTAHPRRAGLAAKCRNATIVGTSAPRSDAGPATFTNDCDLFFPYVEPALRTVVLPTPLRWWTNSTPVRSRHSALWTNEVRNREDGDDQVSHERYLGRI
jgi:hypothetical protein